ncbi:MAG: glycosyltransferase family 9 protein [Acidobacteriota bacterium]
MVRRTGMGTLPARLLIDMPNWLGDFVHALPAVDRLLDANHHGTTILLVPANHAPLARMLGTDAITRRGGEGWWWARRRLRGRFDVALSVRNSTRARLLLAGGRAARRLAGRGGFAGLLGIETFPIDRTRHQRHDLDAALLRLGVAPVDGIPTRLPVGEVLATVGSRRLEQLAGGRPAAAILPASHAMPEKRWPIEHFGELGANLGERGLAPLVLVGPGEGELGCEVAARAGGVPVPTIWPLDEIAALLAGCVVAVGNDSGLTHLAAAAGCPTVALFGPTDPARTAPAGDARMVRCPEGGTLGDLTPAEVLAVVLAVLGPPSSASRPRLLDTGA